MWSLPYDPVLSGGQLMPGRTSPTGTHPGAKACDAELGRLAELDFHDDFRRLTDDGLRKNVAFYAIQPAGLEAFGDQLTTVTNPPTWNAVNNSLGALTSLAASTNGLSIVRTNNIATPFKQLLTTLSDAPSAEVLASMLRDEGIAVRVAYEARGDAAGLGECNHAIPASRLAAFRDLKNPA